MIIIKLLMGHAIADFALQSPLMAKLKNRHNKPDKIPKGQKFVPTWGYWLGSHGLIHGAMVYLFTGNIWLGLIESILHSGIDFMKCENWTTPHLDQIYHFLCKLFYWRILALGWLNTAY